MKKSLFCNEDRKEVGDIDVDFYEDEGVSGVGFDRPEFNRMMRDIDSGRINCVIVKDFSRLGRNHYECDNYMLYIFPQKKVRFISINDNYDSNEPNADSASLLLPIKMIMNDNYAKDYSKKIRSSINAKMGNGEFLPSAGSIPYGYIRNPENKHQLVVDPEAADVVKDIFQKYILIIFHL